jgi:hypothetical protein
MNHGGGIANNYLPICENIFQQLREISLTTSQTLKNKAFPTITSKKQISWPALTFSPWDNQTTKEPSFGASRASR